jgi:hypothetical protein
MLKYVMERRNQSIKKCWLVGFSYIEKNCHVPRPVILTVYPHI